MESEPLLLPKPYKKTKTITLTLQIEDGTPLELRNLALRSSLDIVVREFERAYVIVNPSLNNETLEIKNFSHKFPCLFRLIFGIKKQN